MNLRALQHIVTSARALAEDCQILVLDSASLLASFPDLGSPDGPLATTYDADLCPDPFDDTTGRMLEEALGENRAYYQRHGYHADILRDTIFETLPAGWRDRLVAVPATDGAYALDPHDLAAVKLLVGRPKDLNLLRSLSRDGRIDRAIIKSRIDLLLIPAEQLPRVLAGLEQTFAA